MRNGLTGFICCVMFMLFQPANAQEKPVEEQIMDIITSSSGTVRKWMQAPKLVVIYDQEPYEDEISALVEEINTRVIGFPGFREVEYFDLNRFDGGILDGIMYLGSSSLPNAFSFDQQFALRFISNSGSNSDGIVAMVSGDIFIFLTNTRNGTLFGATLAINSGKHHRRVFAENTAESTCYVNVGSNSDEIISGWIFINSDDNELSIIHCIYEELTQSLGALYDTESSSIFTYNDKSGPILDRSSDYQLLNALYDSSILPGDMPEKVLEEFENRNTIGD